MTWATAVLVFVIVWWCVFFMTLPWGNRAPDGPQTGHAESAPEQPRLWLKAGVTTFVALTLTVLIVYAIEAGFFSFRDWAGR